MDTARFQQLISENTGDVIAVYSLNWKYVQISDSCKNILGYNPQELIDHSIHEKMHPEDLNRILNEMSQLNQSFKSQFISYRIQKKDGTYIWVETLLKRLEVRDSNNYPLMLAVMKDITTRKNSEEMVKKFVEGVQYASDAIVMANEDGQIMYANPAVQILTGYNTEELIGQHANMLWGGLEDANKIVHMWSVLQNNKKVYKGEVAAISKSGRTYYTDVHISPILDQNKDVTFYVGISRDITKAKETDKIKNEFISLVAEKLETPLVNNKNILAKLSETTKEQIKEVVTSTDLMLELVKSLVHIIRIESGKLLIEPVNTSLEEILMGVIDEMDTELKKKNIELKISFQTNVYDVNVDPKLVKNVYTNLLSNAIKYTLPNGKIEVAVYTENDEVITMIKDTGVGIPENEQHNMFEKFYRAENVKSIEPNGTGLGLYLVKAIMEESNGKVWFESKVNQGTTFWISIKASGVQDKKPDTGIAN